MVKQESPLGFRPNAQDSAILAYLKDKFGVGFTQIIKMAIRKLYQQEKRRGK